MMRKVLWAVDTNLNDLLAAARRCRATTICVRTTNVWLSSSLTSIKKQGFDVYGWRWPSARLQGNEDRSHWYARNEAAFAKSLIENGLDGYIVDPECDAEGRPDCWNDSSLAPLAEEFCTTVKEAGRARNTDFVFGLTSGGEYPTFFKKIPWQQFAAQSDVLLPQCYWVGDGQLEHGGTPSAAFTKCVKSWKGISAPTSRIRPIFGDIAHAHVSELEACQGIITTNRLDEVHFYAFSSNVSAEKLDAIASLQSDRRSDLLKTERFAARDGERSAQTIAVATDQSKFNEVQHEAALKLYRFDEEVYPADGCAITLSVLLQTAGIDVPDIFTAISLGRELSQRGWLKVQLGQQKTGDVGSTCGDDPDHGRDHIYLVVKNLNEDEMVIADNQSTRPHFRFVSGVGGKTPTKFFLRAP